MKKAKRYISERSLFKDIPHEKVIPPKPYNIEKGSYYMSYSPRSHELLIYSNGIMASGTNFKG